MGRTRYRHHPNNLVSRNLSSNIYWSFIYCQCHAIISNVQSTGMLTIVLIITGCISLAIGKEGQNVRLAARLTGIKIDINAEGLEKPAR